MQQGFFAIQQTCPRCHGQGKVITDPCSDCRGQGRKEETKTYQSKFPLVSIPVIASVYLAKARRGLMVDRLAISMFK